jgi:sulfoxide reductase catalytic subunit YedY
MHDSNLNVTPEYIYRSRRLFLKAAGFMGAGSLLMWACRTEEPGAAEMPDPTTTRSASTPGVKTDELGDKLTPYDDVTGINNFYEFSTNKSAVKELAQGYPTSPWSIELGGLVNNPLQISMEEMRAFGSEQRIYRMRCVEGWSMVIPWNGFELTRLLDLAEPTGQARYVRFQTAADVDFMPGLTRYPYPWPYVEGLRLDEARHPLTILATGVYGDDLPPQSGGPIRLVVPWTYGVKSSKSIVKIDLVAEQPLTFWSQVAPAEYGFYANVNPDVDHPRWSQATELRLGESGRRPTLLFNGYDDQVGSLYDDMDLRKNF